VRPQQHIAVFRHYEFHFWRSDAGQRRPVQLMRGQRVGRGPEGLIGAMSMLCAISSVGCRGYITGQTDTR
jgi:hypothetical protein